MCGERVALRAFPVFPVLTKTRVIVSSFMLVGNSSGPGGLRSHDNWLRRLVLFKMKISTLS